MVEKLKKDMIEAMKAKDKDRLTVIRMVKAALDQARIDKKVEITDDLLIDVVNKQIKMRNDGIEEFKKANRQDLVDKTTSEIEILKNYLPEQLSAEDVEKIIEEAIKKVEATTQKDMGKVMKEVTPSLKSRTDMKAVSELIKNKLQ